jgi:hypothetical protein
MLASEGITNLHQGIKHYHLVSWIPPKLDAAKPT